MKRGRVKSVEKMGFAHKCKWKVKHGVESGEIESYSVKFMGKRVVKLKNSVVEIDIYNLRSKEVCHAVNLLFSLAKMQVDLCLAVWVDDSLALLESGVKKVADFGKIYESGPTPVLFYDLMTRRSWKLAKESTKLKLRQNLSDEETTEE